MLVQQTGAGSRYIARCCWDAECDCHISDFYANEHIVCVVSVFGIYLYWSAFERKKKKITLQTFTYKELKEADTEIFMDLICFFLSNFSFLAASAAGLHYHKLELKSVEQGDNYNFSEMIVFNLGL